MKTLATIAIAILALIAGPAFARDFNMEVIQLTGDPPSHNRVAPGGGRIMVPGVLYTPAAGANVHGPVILMLDKGPASHTLNHDQITRFAAEKLAARGYTVLSLYGYQERSFPLIRFHDNIWPIESALTWLENAGYEQFAIAAEGYGAVAAADYLASRPNMLLDSGGETRVKALIVVDPLTNLRAWPDANLEAPNYAAKVAAAEISVANGRGLIPDEIEPGQQGSAQTDPWVAAGPYVGPSEAFLDYWGPKAAVRNADLLHKIALPTLALINPANRTTSRNFTINGPLSIGAAGASDADHAAMIDAMQTFLNGHGLGIMPKVESSVIDTTTEGGRVLPGMMYTPVGGPGKGRPTIMLLFGRSTDTMQSSTHWMGWRLAQLGYTVISPSLRIGGSAGFEGSSLAETAQDIGHWIDKAQTMGLAPVVLGGHSNGGIWLSNYLALSQDKRVIGTIFYAPTRDSASYSAQASANPKQYAEDVARMRKAVREGRGMDETIGLLTAHAFMDNNAPESRTIHTQRVREYNLPGLMITGAKDPLMSDAFVAEFAKAYRGPIASVRLENGSHGLRENKDKAMQATADWLGKTFP